MAKQLKHFGLTKDEVERLAYVRDHLAAAEAALADLYYERKQREGRSPAYEMLNEAYNDVAEVRMWVGQGPYLGHLSYNAETQE